MRFSQAYHIPLHHASLSGLHPEAGLVLVTVGDHDIAQVAQDLAPYIRPHMHIAHTSGSTSIEALSPLGEAIGVLYPMQSFTYPVARSLEEVPIFIQGKGKTTALLYDLACRLSSTVQIMSSEDRLRLHLGAVMVCNFTNLLYRLAEENSPDVSIQAYEALIRGAYRKCLCAGTSPSTDRTCCSRRPKHHVTAPGPIAVQAKGIRFV